MSDQGTRWLAGAAGVTAVGTATAVSVARSLRRRVSSDDPYEFEDFGLLDVGPFVAAAKHVLRRLGDRGGRRHQTDAGTPEVLPDAVFGRIGGIRGQGLVLTSGT